MTVIAENEQDLETSKVLYDSRRGVIHSDLTIGADTSRLVRLTANLSLSNRGVIPHGEGFVLDDVQAMQLRTDGGQEVALKIKPYRNGRDIAQVSRGHYVIDLHGLQEAEVREKLPVLYQWVFDRVRPERLENKRKRVREDWWLFAEPRKVLRSALVGLHRYIVTNQVSKHRYFVFMEIDVLPDDKLIAIASDDSQLLSVLSSRIHTSWASSTGSRLGVGNDLVYNKSVCFDTFPFPATSENQQARIRDLGEQLDAHRKKQQSLHPDLTLTGMYNVLEKLRSGEPLTAKEKTIHEQGLVSVLKQIHDDLDAAVFEAYGWPVTLTDEEILERLVALNAERAAEEARGLVRWLRPEFQNPAGGTTVQRTMDVERDGEETPAKGKTPAKPQAKLPWPKKLADQAQAVAQQLQLATKPVTPAELAKSFTRANVDQVTEMLETLVSLGKARELKSGKFAAA